MVRTTITLPEDEYEALKRLAARQRRSISWLVRRAFALSRARLERGEPARMPVGASSGAVHESPRRGGVRTTQDVHRRVKSAVRLQGSRARRRQKSR